MQKFAIHIFYLLASSITSMNTLSGVTALRRGFRISAIRIKSLSSVHPTTQKFDGEISELYSKIALSHLHEDGPWTKMLHATKKSLSKFEGKQLLDIL